ARFRRSPSRLRYCETENEGNEGSEGNEGACATRVAACQSLQAAGEAGGREADRSDPPANRAGGVGAAAAVECRSRGRAALGAETGADARRADPPVAGAPGDSPHGDRHADGRRDRVGRAGADAAAGDDPRSGEAVRHLSRRTEPRSRTDRETAVVSPERLTHTCGSGLYALTQSSSGGGPPPALATSCWFTFSVLNFFALAMILSSVSSKSNQVAFEKRV